MSSVGESSPEGPEELIWVSEWAAPAPMNDAVEFMTHIAALTRTGLPLPSGLRALASELPSKRLKATLNATADKLEMGESLDMAVVDLGQRMPPHLRGLIVAGARSGRLADVLGQFARYASLGAMLRRRFVLALFYPLFLIIVLLGLYLFLCFGIMENFEFVLRDFGIVEPVITTALFKLSQATRKNGGAIVATSLGALIAAAIVIRLTTNAAQRRRMLMLIPLYGKVLRFSVLAEFCHMTGLLVESEMPLPDALPLCAKGVNDADLERMMGKVEESVRYGRSLTDSLAFWPSCPAGLIEVLRGSEARGDLAPALHLAGDMFEARTRSLADFGSILCAIVTVFIVISSVGFVLTALYMPMINLISRLSG